MRKILFEMLMRRPLTEAAPVKDDKMLAELAASLERAARRRQTWPLLCDKFTVPDSFWTSGSSRNPCVTGPPLTVPLSVTVML